MKIEILECDQKIGSGDHFLLFFIICYLFEFNF